MIIGQHLAKLLQNVAKLWAKFSGTFSSGHDVQPWSWWSNFCRSGNNKKVKAFPYSIPSDEPGADLGVQAVSLQMTVSHPPGGRLPLLSARPAVINNGVLLR